MARNTKYSCFEDEKSVSQLIIDDKGLMRGLQREIFFTIDYDGTVEVVDACNYDCCTKNGACEHCQKPVKVARILPSKEEKATCKWNGNKDACGNETCWDLQECQGNPPLEKEEIKADKPDFEAMEEIIDFLCGKSEFNGFWFGDRNESNRKNLKS